MSKLRVLIVGAFLTGAAGWCMVGCGNSAAPGGENCQNSVCPSGGGAYKFCTAPKAASCRYVARDGTTYNCQSCSNCQQAVVSIQQWCSSQTTPTDCNGCSADAQGSGGSCSSQVAACQADSGCTTLSSCLKNCSDSACEQGCSSAAPQGSQTKLNDILTCVCSTCSTQCASQCGGGTTGGGTNGATTGATTGGGTTGGGGSCATCQQMQVGAGGACSSQVNACTADTKCNALVGCLNNCTDMACQQNCASTAGSSSLALYNAIVDCACNQCSTECVAECGGGTTGGGTTGGGTTGGGTTGGGTTGGGTTGGGTTGGGTTGGTTGGGDPIAACNMCMSTATQAGGACKTATDTCNGSTGCVDAWNCTNGCAYGDTACLGGCIFFTSNRALTKFWALVNCICTTACNSECGMVAPQCTP
jgi:hypothetical protein